MADSTLGASIGNHQVSRVMSKFRNGQWVRPVGGTRRGIVSGNRERSVLVRWAGDQKAETCGSRNLVACDPPRALVLEGSLDEKLESTRSEEHLLRTWLDAASVPVAYKSILTIDDLAVIGRMIGDHRPTFVHLSCHGDHDDRRAFILLAPGQRKRDRIYLDDERTIGIFRDAFQDMPILFSACHLGKYEEAMIAFKKAARLKAIAAFTRDVYDYEAMLFELLLYQGILTNGWTFKNAAEKACAALSSLGLRGGRGRGQSFVRVF